MVAQIESDRVPIQLSWPEQHEALTQPYAWLEVLREENNQLFYD